jgi:hypothetical protein
MSSSADPVSSNEQVIYRFAYFRLFGGEVLVTDSRLVLGRETWPIERIQGAEVVSRKMIVSGVPFSRDLIIGMSNGGVLAAAALLLIGFAPQGNTQILFILGGLLLLALSGVIILRAIVRNPSTIYKVKLTIDATEGSGWQYEAQYIFLDTWHADKTVGAIHVAINGKPD